ncbi:MAG: 30S ribosomal protein S7 [Spirochaetes bacterium]|nr:30S ribosomal protein S7 [Spirochaetota bacterium]
MPRRKQTIRKRKVQSDNRFNSVLVSKFINNIMRDGKKSTAERIVYNALEILSKRTKKDSIESLEKALANIKPEVELKSRRVGGATYQIPVEVNQDRGLSLAMRWIIGFATSKKGKSMAEKLAGELFDAFNNTGSAIKKRDDTHKMAEANRAFAHFRW